MASAAAGQARLVYGVRTLEPSVSLPLAQELGQAITAAAEELIDFPDPTVGPLTQPCNYSGLPSSVAWLLGLSH